MRADARADRSRVRRHHVQRRFEHTAQLKRGGGSGWCDAGGRDGLGDEMCNCVLIQLALLSQVAWHEQAATTKVKHEREVTYVGLIALREASER